MNCERCGGLQIWSHFENVGGPAGAWAYDGWLCMNCGSIVDPLIAVNKSMTHATPTGNRVRPFEGKIIWSRPIQGIIPSAQDSTE